MNSRLFSAMALAIVLLFAATQTAGVQSAQQASDASFVVDYYYKAKWGYADEFIRLFRKNHFPVLQKQMEAGRIREVTAVRPRYHATEDGRWDYRVTIVYRNVAAALAPDNSEAIARQLYPDQETFRREEQRRFEILLAHWDLPIVSVDLKTP